MGKSLLNLKLYSYFPSSATWRVRITLNHKALKYQYIPISFTKNGGEQRTPEYEKINPMKHVPALVVNDTTTLVESMAIIEFLEEVQPNPPLLPKDPLMRAKIRGFCELINSGIQPLQNHKVLQRIEKDYKGDKASWTKPWILNGYHALEKYLASIPNNDTGKYCFGNEVTMADVFLAPQVQGSIDRFQLDLKDYPRLISIVKNLQALEAFQKAEPKQQLDYGQ